MAAHVLFHDARLCWRQPGFASLCVVGLSAVALAALTHRPHRPVTRPPVPPIERRPEIRVPADEYGQFWISGTVNGAVLTRFLIDTGASDTEISKSVAQQLDLLRGLRFTAPHSTANGTTYDAPTYLKSLAVAGIVLRDFPADVAGGKTELCLLGMTWLQRFDVKVSDGVLVLTPR